MVTAANAGDPSRSRDAAKIEDPMRAGLKREQSHSRLKRPRHAMPGFVRQALLNQGLRERYKSRPPYQRNDYLGWIMRAKQEKTREKRLTQMLDELVRGDRYMNMVYRPKRKQP